MISFNQAQVDVLNRSAHARFRDRISDRFVEAFPIAAQVLSETEFQVFVDESIKNATEAELYQEHQILMFLEIAFFLEPSFWRSDDYSWIPLALTLDSTAANWPDFRNELLSRNAVES